MIALDASRASLRAGPASVFAPSPGAPASPRGPDPSATLAGLASVTAHQRGRGGIVPSRIAPRYSPRDRSGRSAGCASAEVAPAIAA